MCQRIISSLKSRSAIVEGSLVSAGHRHSPNRDGVGHKDAKNALPFLPLTAMDAPVPNLKEPVNSGKQRNEKVFGSHLS